MPQTTRGRNGRQECRERGYYHLHRNLNYPLLHNFDVSHRVCSRSAKLKQAWLCSRLIAAFNLFARLAAFTKASAD